MRKSLFYLFAVIAVFSSISCGYTTRANLPSYLRTIYVDNLKNEIDYTSESRRDIYFPLLEVDARDAIIDRFLLDGNLRVADKDAADLILTGTLKSYDRDGLRYDSDDDAEEYRVRVTLSLKVYDTQKKEVMWESSAFSGESTYFINGAEATSEASAVNAALEDLARRIVERTVDVW